MARVNATQTGTWLLSLRATLQQGQLLGPIPIMLDHTLDLDLIFFAKPPGNLSGIWYFTNHTLVSVWLINIINHRTRQNKSKRNLASPCSGIYRPMIWNLS